MKNIYVKSICAAAFFALLPFGISTAQTPQPDKTSATYGAWTLTCTFHASKKVQTGAGTKTVDGSDAKAPKRVKVCEVAQRYGASGTANQAMLAFAGSPRDPKQTLAAFRAPVDVFLLFNPSISVDDTEIAKGRFVRCVVAGCSANFVFDQAALDKLAAAKRGALVYKQSRGNLVTIPIVGTGLNTALAAFKAQQK